MSGKHYNRSVRAHKLMYEALSRLRFQSFLTSKTKEEEEEILEFLGAMRDSFEDQNFEDYVKSPLFKEIVGDYQAYVNQRCAESELFAFWSVYLEMVQLLLLHLRATRTGNWDLHLSTVKSMLPWFFVTDRINYCRYASCYWLEMSILDQTHKGW